MRRETLQEKSFHDMLPPHFAAIAQVSFSYQDMLRIAQDHLKTFYEDRADWKKCIERYFHSAEYQDNCHYVSTCEDIPIVTTEQLHRMIQEDEQYQVKVKEFLNFQQAIEADRQSVALDDLYHAAELLGIHPEQKSVGLYNWIISRDGMSSEEEIMIEASNPVPTPLLGHRCRSSQEITGSPTPFSTSNHYLWICASASFSLSNPNIAA